MSTVIFRVQTKPHFLLYLWHIFKSLHNTEKKVHVIYLVLT